MTGPRGRAGASLLPSTRCSRPSLEPITIEESARLVGAWGWAESRLLRGHRRLGALGLTPGGARSTSIRAASITLGELGCGRNGGPACPPTFSPDYGESGPAMAGLAALMGDVERLSAYCRVVLPRVVVGYRSWQRRCSATGDQPVARALGFAVADALADWERGCGLLEGYLGDEGAGHAAVAAAGATAEIDQLVAEHGWWPSVG